MPGKILFPFNPVAGRENKWPGGFRAEIAWITLSTRLSLLVDLLKIQIALTVQLRDKKYENVTPGYAFLSTEAR